MHILKTPKLELIQTHEDNEQFYLYL